MNKETKVIGGYLFLTGLFYIVIFPIKLTYWVGLGALFGMYYSVVEILAKNDLNWDKIAKDFKEMKKSKGE